MSKAKKERTALHRKATSAPRDNAGQLSAAAPYNVLEESPPDPDNRLAHDNHVEAPAAGYDSKHFDSQTHAIAGALEAAQKTVKIRLGKTNPHLRKWLSAKINDLQGTVQVFRSSAALYANVISADHATDDRRGYSWIFYTDLRRMLRRFMETWGLVNSDISFELCSSSENNRREVSAIFDTARAIDFCVDLIDTVISLFDPERIFASRYEGPDYDVSKEHYERDRRLAALNGWLAEDGVPRAARVGILNEMMLLLERASIPKWKLRGEYDATLLALTSPEFLRKIHDERIRPDGTVVTEVIRAIDDPLMDAVSQYISQRDARNQDRGDAAGLKFEGKRPAPNKRPAGPKIRPSS